MLIRTTLSLLVAGLAAAPLYAEKGSAVKSAFSAPAALQYIAPPGTIRQGEVIAVLDCTAITAKLKIHGEEIAAAEKKISELEEKLKVTQAINREKIENAAESLVAAERDLAKYLENDAPGKEVALKLALHDAETEFKKQEERYGSRDKLLAEGFIHKVEYDNEETRLRRTQLALQAARLKMAAFQKYEREAREALLTQAVKKGKEEQAAVEREIESAIGKITLELEAATANLETLKQKQEKLTAELNQTIIRAAKAGKFTQADSVRGEIVATGQVLGYVAE